MWADGYEEVFRERAKALGVEDRVHILPPALPEQLVERAAQHDVGLALESDQTENRRIAVSNKILNYLLAGLSIAATDVPGQGGIREDAPGRGILSKPGDAQALSRGLEEWSADPAMLQRCKALSRQYGQVRFCWEKEKEKLIRAVADLLAD